MSSNFVLISLLLDFVPIPSLSIDYRSNNYRNIIDSALLPTIDPNFLIKQVNNNPYFDLFTTTTTFSTPIDVSINQQPHVPDFPLKSLAVLDGNRGETLQSTTRASVTVAPAAVATTTTTTKSTETLWTTSKSPLKLSKNPKPSKIGKKSTNSTFFNSIDSAAQLSVLSHRLLNDVLIIPSSRRLYILAILPIHQASSQNFECGEIDLNAVVRLSAFLDSLKNINESNMLKDIGATIGAIIIDSCSTDLRSVADLYELLSGTNIQKTDLIAIIRDDPSFMPNTEQIMKQLQLPVINTFFSVAQLPRTTGVLPSMSLPIQAIIAALKNYQSTCVNLIYDDKFENSALEFQRVALSHGICVEGAHSLLIQNTSTTLAESVVRRLLLSEARIVVALLTDQNWIQMMKALRTEMVISARFVFIAIQNSHWTTSRLFIEAWPTFEQNLITIEAQHTDNTIDEMRQLAEQLPKIVLPNAWLKQFWASAFKCHVVESDEQIVGRRRNEFSKECDTSQHLNITKITPNVDVSSISIAVQTVGMAFRSFVDRTCPGALVISLSDCINDPFETFYQTILDTNFVHHLSDNPVSFNHTTGYRHIGLKMNRVQFLDDRIQLTEIGKWDESNGFSDSNKIEKVSTSRGSYLLMSSTCPRSKCFKLLASQSIQQQIPTIFHALSDVDILIFSIFSVLSCLICLMCMYLKVISTSEYRNCTAICFLGLAFLSLSSPAFLMPPNSISCSLRKLLFPISFSIIMAPIFVKTFLIWRFKKSEQKSTSCLVLTLSLITIQCVISIEWVTLTTSSPTEFVSTVHGTMWRCSSGDTSEPTILISCFLSAILSIFSLIFSLASLKRAQSLQHLMISMLTIFFETSLYVSLPLLPYKTRDIVMATAILVFSFVTLLISHLNRSMDQNSNPECGTIQKNENWLHQIIQTPNGSMNFNKNYHTATTLPQPTVQSQKKQKEIETNFSDDSSLPHNSLYGVEAYELPTGTLSYA